MDSWSRAPGAPAPPRGPPTTTPQLGGALSGPSPQGGYHALPAGGDMPPPQTYVQMAAAAGSAGGAAPQTMYNPQPPAQLTVPSLSSHHAAPQTTYNGLGLAPHTGGPSPRTRDVQGSGPQGSPLECILRPSATGSPVCKLRAFGIACFILGLLTGSILGHFFQWLWWLLGVILLLCSLFLIYWFCFHSRAGRATRGLGRVDKGEQEGMVGGRDESESDDCC